MGAKVGALRIRCVLQFRSHAVASKHGFAGLTMRDIASSAKTNVASAHYHFGSKEGIVFEMLRRRIEPVNNERMKRLLQARRHAGNNPLNTQEIFSALILPIGDAIRCDPDSHFIITQLVARSYSEPVEFIEKIHRCFFGELALSYVAELSKTYPEISEKEIYWHFHLAVSSMLGALAQHRRLEDFSNGNCDSGDVEGMISRLIRFVSSGFDAGVKELIA